MQTWRGVAPSPPTLDTWPSTFEGGQDPNLVDVLPQFAKLPPVFKSEEVCYSSRSEPISKHRQPDLGFGPLGVVLRPLGEKKRQTNQPTSPSEIKCFL